MRWKGKEMHGKERKLKAWKVKVKKGNGRHGKRRKLK